ncbi:VWA domain-containing protein [Microbacterium sp. bgisy203]|uniref:VWA domain-containing protein n=1 Tax=Microbacterium sp. bgisy203 TaxID=3413799 RepID=UPI003D73A423
MSEHRARPDGALEGAHERALDGDLRRAWEDALALWSVRMHDARILPGEGARVGAPAWFSFPPEIAVDPEYVAHVGGAGEFESVFAHEIGHHVLAPSTRIDALKIRHQLARALVDAGRMRVRDDEVALLSNLWTDLLVNTRVANLQRRRDGAGEPGIVRVSRALYRSGHDTTDRLWWLYLRAYERLWHLPPGELVAPEPPAPPAPAPRADTDDMVDPAREPARLRGKARALQAAQRARREAEERLAAITRTHPEADADSVARLVRAFASDPVSGALRFGLIAAPYLVDNPAREDEGGSAGGGPDGGAAAGCAADTAPATDAEIGQVLSDPRVNGAAASAAGADTSEGSDGADGADAASGQALELAHTLELYGDSDAAAVMAAWYRSQARRWVRPYTHRAPALPASDLPGPIATWETGDDLADIDWSATFQSGPVVVPGVTTRRRTVLDDEPLPAETGLDLDLYIDSSGSMASPESGSPAVLAGTILVMSVLRGGGRARVTSFSGGGQVAGGDRFSRDETALLGDLAFFFGAGTSFPLDLLERRYSPLPAPDDGDRRHLVVLSDDGLTSLFGDGNQPYAHVAAQTRAKLTTATLVVAAGTEALTPLAAAAGYDIIPIASMDDAPAVCARLAEVLHG